MGALRSDVELLPDFPLDATDGVSARLVACGVGTFHAAARWVQALPYGRNADRADFRLVLDEERGTCSTKHALLAHLARVRRAPVELTVGIYEMDARNTPGVGAVLARHGIASLPEAHCYLRVGDERVDLTRSLERAGAPVAAFLHEEAISVEGIGAYKVELHRSFLSRWLGERGLADRLPLEAAWRIREECIAALGSA